MKDGTTIPAGATELTHIYLDGGSIRLYLHDDSIVVTGQPRHTENEGLAHNCDEMGCGWEHVLYRGKVADLSAAREEAAEMRAQRDEALGDEHRASQARNEMARALQSLRDVAESFADTVDRAERAATQKGGQQAPYHDDFASAPPSTRGQLRRWANAFREASR